ncbi:hypothetical protein UlMin_042962 [Ulmus minor]
MDDDKPEQDHELDLAAEPITDGSDICQQLMDRYAKSKAPQHRHLLATAAAMRSILSSESLPLTPPAYFAAVISAIDEASSNSQTLEVAAVAALLSFLAIVLPAVPPEGIVAEKASEAVEVLVLLAGREKEGLAVSTVRALVKCLGVLVGFCDFENWDSLKLGFQTLLSFSVDKRPKVRRCSQECLEKVFKSINSSSVIKEASKLVMSMLKTYMPSAVELSNSGASVGPKDDTSAEPKNVEILHMLNVLKLIVPFLSMKGRSKVLSELDELMRSQFSALTRHILKTIEVCFETSSADVITSVTENIMDSLSSYVSSGDKKPSDTVMSATTLLKRSLDILRAGESSSYVKNLPIVCDSVAGLLTSETMVASHAAIILKELVNDHVDPKNLLIDDNQPFDEGKETIEATTVKSTCAVLENCLMNCDGEPNEHTLVVISALFLKLGGTSYFCMRNILLKLADLMTLSSGGKFNTVNLRKCIGSAVIAMGPERILTHVSISLNADDLTCSNMWLVPILKNHVVGASLEYYMKHIMPLAKSFQQASRKGKKTTGQDLQAHAHDLFGLLPAFCRYPTDLHQNIGPLAKVLIKFLKKHSFMLENVVVAIQVLVNQSKSALNLKNDAGESCAIKESVLEFSNLPTYSKKIATKNMKAISTYSAELLQALTDLFIDSLSGKRSIIKDAIGCLASITDSSITKKIFVSLLERYKFIDDAGEFGILENESMLIDEEEGKLSNGEKDAQRCVVLELASSLVEGAKEDFIDLIYNFIKYSFQVTDGISVYQAYYTLSRILQEHDWFCSSRSVELIDLLQGLKSPIDNATLRSRFSCFHPLMVHILKIDSEADNAVDSEAENAKAFLIVNEIILTLKDAKEEEARKVAYDVLLEISSSLKDMSTPSSDGPYQKLVNMIMGYLTGASPHIKSGAVSVLSVLIHQDADIFLSIPELIPSILSLLQGKSVEVIKAVLGFVKVLVSSLQARDLQSPLSDIVNAVLHWSHVSRNHFRSKITVIIEILIRKCGFSAVEQVTQDKYRRFVKSVAENRKTNQKDAASADAETRDEETSAKRQEKRKHGDKDSAPEKAGFSKHGKRNQKHTNHPGAKDSNMSTGAGGERRSFGAKRFGKENPFKGRQERSGKSNKNFDRGPPSHQKRKMNTHKKDEGAAKKPGTASPFHKRRKLGRP